MQLQHRLLALSTLGAVGTLFVSTRSLPLHPTSRLLVSAALGVTALQVGTTDKDCRSLTLCMSASTEDGHVQMPQF